MIRGLPRRDGSSLTSTAAKNASISTCIIVLSICLVLLRDCRLHVPTCRIKPTERYTILPQFAEEKRLAFRLLSNKEKGLEYWTGKKFPLMYRLGVTINRGEALIWSLGLRLRKSALSSFSFGFYCYCTPYNFTTISYH